MSPQALRFAQGRILGETNTSWYVGEVTLENERRIMECISKLDTDEIKSPYREDIRPDGEEFVMTNTRLRLAWSYEAFWPKWEYLSRTPLKF